jgi:hypothetical protein
VNTPDRALTLWQPWAWLVAAGHKPIENRPRGFSHKSFRGDFWIHAGSAPLAQGGGHLFDAKLIDAWQSARVLCDGLLGHDFELPPLNAHAYGAIIGRATVVGIMPPRQPLIGERYPMPVTPWHFPDQYGFRVEGAQLLAKPVPCRGFQGFWKVPTPVLEQLKGAA